VVVAHEEPNAGPLRNTVDLLFGPGRDVSDVWVWKL
jgi:hypothetical protein